MSNMYEYWLANVNGISGKRKRLLRETQKNAEMLYYIEETKLISEGFLDEKERKILCESRKIWNLKQEYEKLAEKSIRFIPYFSEAYPKRLLDLPGMPYALYAKGHIPDHNRRTAAIVGARRCTRYGEQMTLKFAGELAEYGIQIISGMAKGIDGAGHRGALNGGGETFAVLGCGVDVCYPVEHNGLYKDILKRGGVLSEYPPGTTPFPSHFPARNRIISGLADVVLVMEAKERSGSLITADMALEQGKDIYALPGPVTSELSSGCLGLIKQGAGVLTDTKSLMSEVKNFQDAKEFYFGKKKDKSKITLESSENLVYSKLDLYPKSRGTILEETGIDAQSVARVLVSLVLKGYIYEVAKDYYVRQQ